MGLEQRLDKLEALMPSREDCPVCNAPPREGAKVREGFHATGEYIITPTCHLCGGERRIVITVFGPIDDGGQIYES